VKKGRNWKKRRVSLFALSLVIGGLASILLNDLDKGAHVFRDGVCGS
jgi:hypothetical protein